MAGFSLSLVYSIKNRQMSHGDDYASTLDLSERTEIKAGGKTIISFDLSWKHSSFFRHEVTVVVKGWGGSQSPFHVPSVRTHLLLGTEPVSELTHSDFNQRHLPQDCTWVHRSLLPLAISCLIPVFGLVLVWFGLLWIGLVCFVLFSFALLGWLLGKSQWKGMPWCRLQCCCQGCAETPAQPGVSPMMEHLLSPDSLGSVSN